MVNGFRCRPLNRVSPGPQWAITIKSSLSSKRNGISTVFGMCSGSMIHIAYCLIGIGVLISQSILLFSILKWLGAGYLIYMGLKSLFSKIQQTEFFADRDRVANQLNCWKFYRVGLLTSLLNPKATLFYLSLFTQVVDPQSSIYAQFFYGYSVVAIEMIWYSLMVTFLSHNIYEIGYRQCPFGSNECLVASLSCWEFTLPCPRLETNAVRMFFIITRVFFKTKTPFFIWYFILAYRKYWSASISKNDQHQSQQ
ncbi:LysE family transporter [Bacillus sp. V3-13]|uniref:LysE family transporter n=1 Tax=Bacillus sp. V3-13 TaxID=2053728 RepID=UPI0027E52836|nr:LysE family transporter [Bacillus sp. V3-13]